MADETGTIIISMQDLAHYVNAFRTLRADAVPGRYPALCRGRAPHKSILLLAVIDALAEGSITTNEVRLTPDIADLFSNYWACVFPTERPGNIAMPFFYLRNERSAFWRLIPRPGSEDLVSRKQKIASVTQLDAMLLGARLDEALYELLLQPEPRQVLREALIQSAFTEALQSVLLAQTDTNIDAFRLSERLLQGGDCILPADAEPDAVRSQGFRRAVVIAYAHHCAFCRLHIVTPDGHTAVQTSHIVPWSVNHRDEVANGLTLCQTCHWAFDEGLTTVSGALRIVLSPTIRYGRNSPGYFLTLQNTQVNLPELPLHAPDPEAFAYHRRKIYCAR